MSHSDLLGLAVAVIASVLAYWKSKDDVKGHVAALVLVSTAALSMIVGMRYATLPQLEEKLTLSAKYLNNRDAMALVADYSSAADAVHAASTVPFLAEYFAKQRDTYRDHLRDAQNGRYRVEKSDIGVFANRVIEKATRSVIATSYVASVEWWDTPWGREFEALNYEKAKTGVRITRYFLFADKGERERARPLLARHVANKIDVFVVDPRDTADTYWNDVIIVDDSFGGELLLTPEKTIRHVVMYTRPEDVQRLRDVVSALRVRATPARRILEGAR